MFHPWTLDFTGSICLDLCFRKLRQVGVGNASKVLKGWINGWATSRRYHEDRLLLGCLHEKDQLEHYLQCPHLFALGIHLASHSDADPLVRWGLVNPSTNNFKINACIYSGYHSLRRVVATDPKFTIISPSSLSGHQIRVAWSVFADTFSVDARELGVPHTKFSLASFLNQLNAAQLSDCLSAGPFEWDEPVSLDHPMAVQSH